MGESGRTIYSRVVRYRDDTGKLCESRITSTDKDQLNRWATAIRHMEQVSAQREKRWHDQHVAFTDASIRPETIAKTQAVRASQAGYAWEGPRYTFALLLGEGAVWSGADSLWLWHAGRKRWVCRFCGHYGRGLPLVAYCLGCDRSGRDLVIPKGRPRAEVSKPKDDGLRGGVG